MTGRHLRDQFPVRARVQVGQEPGQWRVWSVDPIDGYLVVSRSMELDRHGQVVVPPALLEVPARMCRLLEEL